MAEYDSYEQTSIPWNEKRPSHWHECRGKALFRTKKERNTENQETNILSLTLRGVIRNSKDNPIGLSPSDYSTYQIFEKDDLVFKLIDLNNISTSRVGIVPERGIMSSAYIRLIARHDLNIRYFYMQYYNLWLRNVYNGLGAGVRQTISADELLNMSIVVPPRAEQDQIVRFLDWKVSEINKLILINRKQIGLLKEILAKKISEVITRGLDSNVAVIDSGTEWIGKIPEHWTTIRCKYLFKERDQRSEYGKEQHLSMSQKYGLIPDSMLDERRMLSASYKGGKLCYKDDLVLNRLKAHLGVFALAPQFGVISPDYTVLQPNVERIIPAYAEMVLKSQRCRGELMIRVRGITEGFWRLYTDDFNTIVIPVPPIEEQKIIISYIDEYKAKINDYIAVMEREIDTLHELRRSVISDAVTGKIDVRGISVPAYEHVDDTASDNSECDEESEETAAEMGENKE